MYQIRTLILVCIFACAFAARTQGATNHPASEIGAMSSAIGKTHGKQSVSNSDGPLLLQFWASWCHRCSSLFAELDTVASKHPYLKYYAVSIDPDQSSAVAYLNKNLQITENLQTVSFRHALDRRLEQKYEISSVPTVLLIAPNGQVLNKIVGHLTKSDLFKITTHLGQLSEGAAK